MKVKKEKKQKYWVGQTVYIQGTWRAIILSIANKDMIYVKILEGHLGKELDSGRGTFKESMLSLTKYAV